jgi:hypothetical protein
MRTQQRNSKTSVFTTQRKQERALNAKVSSRPTPFPSPQFFPQIGNAYGSLLDHHLL